MAWGSDCLPDLQGGEVKDGWTSAAGANCDLSAVDWVGDNVKELEALSAANQSTIASTCSGLITSRGV